MESNNAKCIDELRAIKDSIECCLLQQVRKGDVDIDALETWCKAVVKRINAALAKPERNCERFNNGLDAIHGWEDYLEKHPELPPSCMTSGAMIPWLFEFSGEKGKTNAST